MTPEHQRLAAADAAGANWRKWGPYLAERQWGTVREDLSASGDAWNHFPHDHARSRAYRWGEDGLAGISDETQTLCFALALWNGVDPILKERLFGLTNAEGNHGEDVKEYYFYLDATPTHSYMRYLYKYPQRRFPYDELTAVNRRRGRHEPEFELLDTGVFDDDAAFDVVVEYAKAAPEDILIVLTLTNRGTAPAVLHVLPTLWFRNTWASPPGSLQPNLSQAKGAGGVSIVAAIHHELGDYYLYCDRPVPLLFTANETNAARLFGQPNRSRYVKDGINEYVVNGHTDAVNPAMTGTKAAAHYQLEVPAAGSEVIRLRLTNLSPSALRLAGHGGAKPLAVTFDHTLATRREEADAFFATIIPPVLDADRQRIMRQALAGMLWSKQTYLFDVRAWLREHGAGGEGQTALRNQSWQALDAHDVLSMPDKWEYPWFAAWDLAFHAVPLAMLDAEFAKGQLSLILGDRYLNANGQIPAYEWNFSDASPPVHAWATRFVYHADRQQRGGGGDLAFYKRAFTRLIANFTWWLNRTDSAGRTVLDGGLVGLDTTGVFDGGALGPGGGRLEASGAAPWLAFYATSLFAVASDLAATDPLYADWAGRFLDTFARITAVLEGSGGRQPAMWDEADGFFYEVVRLPGGECVKPRVRSLAGLVPLFAVFVYPPPGAADPLAALTDRGRALAEAEPTLVPAVALPGRPGIAGRLMLAAVGEARLKRILARVLDPAEFLSEYGIRSVSRQHLAQPVAVGDGRLAYEPAEAMTGAAGGNANWRGPVWLPLNLLLIDALLAHYTYYGDQFVVEYPTGSGRPATLFAIAADIAERLIRLFCVDEQDGGRPIFRHAPIFRDRWRDLLLFYEYFHGETGAGLGASHQTGWTGAIAKLIQFFATTTAAETLEKGLGLFSQPTAEATAEPQAPAPLLTVR